MTLSTTVARYLNLQSALAAGMSALIIFLVSTITTNSNGIIVALFQAITLLFLLWLTVKIVENAKAIADWIDARIPKEIIYIDRVPLATAIDRAKYPTLDPPETGPVQTPSTQIVEIEDEIVPYQVPS